MLGTFGVWPYTRKTMQNLDLSFAQDPNTLVLALVAGVVPALLWIMFWVRENRERPRRSGVLFAAFLIGLFMVILALPVEKAVATLSNNDSVLTILWAASEEVLKFGGFLLILFMSSSVEVPIDYPVYLMMVALGFAGFENALYFLQPLQAGTTNVLILAGSMRFLGSTLMHSVATCMSGIGLGFAYFSSRGKKMLAALAGLLLAITIHSTFNLFIPSAPNMTFAIIMACLWLATIIVLIIFERLRKRGSLAYFREHRMKVIASFEVVFQDLLAKAGMMAVDPHPLAEGLVKPGMPAEVSVQAELAGLVKEMRAQYSRYLYEQGAKKKDADLTAANLIPDTVSPQALSGIFSVLKAPLVPVAA